MLLTECMAKSLSGANKYHLENDPFCRQGASFLTYLCALQKSTRNKQAIKVNPPIHLEINQSSIIYDQILKLTYTEHIQTNNAKYCNRKELTFKLNFHSLEYTIIIFLLAFLSVFGKVKPLSFHFIFHQCQLESNKVTFFMSFLQAT